jgi:hypothetical protein
MGDWLNELNELACSQMTHLTSYIFNLFNHHLTNHVRTQQMGEGQALQGRD